jgi:hypothetical protein
MEHLKSSLLRLLIKILTNLIVSCANAPKHYILVHHIILYRILGEFYKRSQIPKFCKTDLNSNQQYRIENRK